ncbi:MAG: hypothetical protein KDA22_04920 [Phycisphaerales bacterium]|nr:hypothetical protein [Phycisphaerales bacterium]
MPIHDGDATGRNFNWRMMVRRMRPAGVFLLALMLASVATGMEPRQDGPGAGDRAGAGAGAGADAGPVAPPVTQVAQDTTARTTLNGEIDLARLVDLAAQRLKFDVEYDAAALKGMVTLRLQEGLTDDELWALTNQLLATRGFTSVTRPGSTMVSIVKIADAPGQSRVERPEAPDTASGFVTLVTRVHNRDVKDILEALKLVLSKPGGTATALGDTGLVLVSDLKPRIDQATYILDLLDVPAAVAVVEVVPATNIKATELSGLVTAAMTARDEVVGKKMRGKIVPMPDGTAVVITAPEEEMALWKEFVERFDQRQGVQTRNYVPKHFPANDVARLIEQAGRDNGPRGSGTQWKLVVDDLTSTLIVTATPAEHEQIASLLARIEDMSAGVRRQVRTYVIRNRPVGDVLDVLTSLIDAGVLESTTGTAAATGTTGSAAVAAGGEQRTDRTVLPPGAESVVPPPTNAASQQSTGAVAAANAAGQRRGGGVRASSRIGPDGEPLITLTADAGTNSLLAVGEPRLLAQVEQLLKTIDVRQSQVMLEVLVVGLSDTEAVDFGIQLQKIVVDGNTVINLASLFGLAPPIGGLGGLVPPDGGDTPTVSPRGFVGTAIDPGSFSAVVRALEELNKGRSLNMPKLLVNNNEEATINSVLQQPVLSTNASTTVATTSFGGTQDAGTTVTVRPQIAEGDHLILQYSVAISAFVGKSTDPSLPPPRQQNAIESVVTIPDGYTVVVGGLRVDTEAKGTSQIPLVGDVPVLGELFKSRSNASDKSRFFVFLRANILRHDGFEDLKYLSDVDSLNAGIEDWPRNEPRVIR